MTRLVDLKVTKAAWVEDLDDPANPTVAELVAGLDITCDLTTAYEVRADASNSVSEMGVCDDSEVAVPTSGKHMGNLVLFRNFLATGKADADDLLGTFAGKYEHGYFVRRIGLPPETPWAANDAIEVYEFIADRPQIQGGTGAGFLKMTVPLFPQGFSVVATKVAT